MLTKEKGVGVVAKSSYRSRDDKAVTMMMTDMTGVHPPRVAPDSMWRLTMTVTTRNTRELAHMKVSSLIMNCKLSALPQGRSRRHQSGDGAVHVESAAVVRAPDLIWNLANESDEEEYE